MFIEVFVLAGAGVAGLWWRLRKGKVEESLDKPSLKIPSFLSDDLKVSIQEFSGLVAYLLKLELSVEDRVYFERLLYVHLPDLLSKIEKSGKANAELESELKRTVDELRKTNLPRFLNVASESGKSEREIRKKLRFLSMNSNERF